MGVKYRIRQVIVTKPEVELPEGSQVASVKHHGAYRFIDSGVEVPEMWQVIYLEPAKEGNVGETTEAS